MRPGKVHERFLSERSEQTRFGEGRKRQRGERPRISILMDINNLEIRSLIKQIEYQQIEYLFLLKKKKGSRGEYS